MHPTEEPGGGEQDERAAALTHPDRDVAMKKKSRGKENKVTRGYVNDELEVP